MLNELDDLDSTNGLPTYLHIIMHSYTARQSRFFENHIVQLCAAIIKRMFQLFNALLSVW